MLNLILYDIVYAIAPSLVAGWMCYHFRPSARKIAHLAVLVLLVSLALPALKIQTLGIGDQDGGVFNGWKVFLMSFSPLILTPPGLMSAIANVLFLLSYVMVLRRSDTMFYLSRFSLGIAFSALILCLFAGRRGFLEFDLKYHPGNRLYIGAGTWLCSHLLLSIATSKVGNGNANLSRLRIPSLSILTLIGVGLILSISYWSVDEKKTEWQRVEFVSYSSSGDKLISSITNLKGHIYDLKVDESIIIWDLETKQVLHRFPLQYRFPTCYAHSPAEDLLAYGIVESPYGPNTKGLVVLMSTQTGEIRSTLQGHTGEVLEISFSGDGAIVATASRDRTVRLWRVSDGIELKRFDAKFEVLSVALSPDGQKLAYCPSTTVPALDSSIVYISNWQSDPEKSTVIQSTKTSSMRLAFSQDAMKLASVSWNGVVTLWNLDDTSNPHSIANQSQRVTSLCFSPKDYTFAYGSYDNVAAIWDGEECKAIKNLKHPVSVRSIAFSPDGTQLVTGEGGTWSFEGAQGLRFWNTVSGEFEFSLDLSLAR